MEIDGRSAVSKRRTVTGSSEPCDSEVEGVEKYSVSPKLTATLPEGLTDKAAPLTLTSTSNPVPEGAEDQGKPPWWGAAAAFIGGGLAAATGFLVSQLAGIKTLESSVYRSQHTGFLTEVDPGQGLPPLWEQDSFGETVNPFQSEIDFYNPPVNELERWKAKGDYYIDLYSRRQREDLEWLAENAKTLGKPSYDLPERWGRGVSSPGDMLFDVSYCQSEMASISMEKRLVDHRISDIKKHGVLGFYAPMTSHPNERFVMLHNRRIPEELTSENARNELKEYLERKKHHKEYWNDEVFESVYADAIKNSDVILGAEDDLRKLGADMSNYKWRLPDH